MTNKEWQERQERLAEIMKIHAVEQSEAEFILAIELKELDGDVQSIQSTDT